MTAYIITSPEGKKYRVSGQGSKEEALSALRARLSDTDAQGFDAGRRSMPTGKSTPDGNPMDDSEVRRSVNRQTFDMQPTWKKPLIATGDLGAIAFNDGTMGLGTKLMAAAKAGATGRDYADVRGEMNATLQAARDRAGGAGAAAGVGASMVAPTKLAGIGLTGTAIPKVGSSVGLVADGMGYGAANAYGNDQNIGEGMAVGGLLGAAGQGLGKAIGSVFQRKANATLPTYEKIASDASQKYRAADAEGVVYNNAAVKNLLSDIEGKFAGRTFEPVLQPGAARVINVLQQRVASGNPITAETLKAIRTAAGEQFIRENPSNNALLNIVKESIDDFAANAKPSDVLVGNSSKAAALRQEANSLWAQKKKIETVRKALTLAENRAARTGSGGNYENTVKQELSKILNDPRKARGFTKDEIAAIEAAVYNQTGRDALRLVGKLNPLRHGGAAAVGLGGAFLNPLIAGATMAGGALAHTAANAIQKSRGSAIERLIAAGGNKANLPKVSPQKLKAIESLARALTYGGVGAVNQYQ